MPRLRTLSGQDLLRMASSAWSAAPPRCRFLDRYRRNLDKSLESMSVAKNLGFPNHKRAHLIGISDYTTPWHKELRLARAQGLGSVVLFALDQFSLIGYPAPLPPGMRRSGFMGR